MRVLVVDDQEEILESIALTLQSEGIEVIGLQSGEKVVDELAKNHHDAVLLDQLMPNVNGIEVLRRIRENPLYRRLPVLMVTGLGDENQIIEALENGADDYVTKPFKGKALAARIRAVVRRCEQPNLESEILRAKNMVLNRDAHRLLVDDREVELTLTEYKILEELFKGKGKVLTRDLLRERALGSTNVTDRTIDVHMASLRKKLGPNSEFIQTVRGVGYRFEVEVTAV